MGEVSQLTHQLLVQLSIDILYMRIHQSLHLWVQPFGMKPSERTLLIFSKVAFVLSFHCNAVALTLADVVNSLLRGSTFTVSAQLLTNGDISLPNSQNLLHVCDNGKTRIAFTLSCKG